MAHGPILVPHDFGEGSDAALTYALEVARALRCEIVLMHAYDLPMMGFPDGALVGSADLSSKLLEGVSAGVERTLAAISGSGVPARSIVRQGDSWRAIVEVADEIGARMIVMGTHGRRGLPRALLGSVAEKVVRTAHCPVLTVHAPSKDDRDVLHP
jgi:nucleotide-binding universal stress UspA family protein